MIVMKRVNDFRVVRGMIVPCSLVSDCNFSPTMDELLDWLEKPQNRIYNYAKDLNSDSIVKIEKWDEFGVNNVFGHGSWSYPTPEELRLWLRKNSNFRVELELHTKTVGGHECITFKGTSERFFWAEVMTHRNSRNASSARAIPYKKMKAWILKDPAMHLHYGANRPGMQSGGQITDVDGCEKELLEILDYIYDRMDGIVSRYDLHKEIANRYTEAFSWINWIASFSKPSFHNMLNLRAEEHAHPNFQRLAVQMARLYRSSEPILLQLGEWHMPMIGDFRDLRTHSLTDDHPKIKDYLCWSVARSAWTSFRTVEDKIATFQEACNRHDSCVSLLHATPLEHQNRARGDDGRNGGTMPGYDQYRHMINGESRPEFDFSKLDTVYANCDYVIKD